MIKKTLFVSALAVVLSVSGSQAFAKSKDKGDSKKSSKSSSVELSKKSDSDTDKKPDSATPPTSTNNSTTNTNNNNTADAAPAPAPAGGGAGTAIAAGVGGAVIGGLAGAAIASSMSGDDKPAATTTTIEKTAPSPLLKMTPEEALKSAKEMQVKASEAGFSFSKSDEMLKKAEELAAKDDAGKKQAQEIAVMVHTWAEAGVKQADELKKVAEKLGL
ncbi:MAG: hypothetical protein KAH03_04435 [Cocleimonas sp.]|nr:hypothetical protein [Cocleimonas sp.]